ncbi:MAG: adenylate/guanylate cyclase domain-containing protein [Pirellulales bacterium]|nr:adenylate/guanylate cyclase domain-containing protein [Pirellulales bacterium]
MPDLIAQGTEAQQRWRRSLPEGQAVVLGRLLGTWGVPWDQHVSRRHVRLLWDGRRLEVSRLAEARNPVYLLGKEAEHFTIGPGEHFVIGQTAFTLTDQRVNITAYQQQPVQQQTFSPQYLRQVSFRNPDHRIEVLARLPEVISGAAGDAELCVRLVSMLLAGVPRADAAAVVECGKRNDEGGMRSAECEREEEKEGEEDEGEKNHRSERNSVFRTPHSALHIPYSSPIRVLHWDQRQAVGSDFLPSQGLILESLRQRQSVLHVWRGSDQTGGQAFTESENYDWAFCTPVTGPTGDRPKQKPPIPEGDSPIFPAEKSGQSPPGWVLYVAGRFNVERPGVASTTDPTDLREDVKFTELVAVMLSSLREMRLLERQHASLSQFFSPVVLETLAVEDPEVVLAPRETEVSVLFCDLRGFSRESERSGGDLLGLLQRVSKALGVMTRHIRTEGGVVGDFQGDAAMGFWGWPLPDKDSVLRTCRAALAIRAELAGTAGFYAGIGIATGPAVAGKIGTVDQVKVTVFGPVVNLASRLEGMTKIVRAPILLDERTAKIVRRQVPREVARLRRLAVVKPFGLDTPLEISELLPPEAEYPLLSDEHLEHYEAALDRFLARNWSAAFELLHRIPAEDEVKDFLTVYIAEHNRRPPPGWNGIIPLEKK